jgi:hypothetical protein
MESVTEFAEYEPPRRLRVRIVEGPLPVDGLWELEPVGGGTRIRFQAEGAAKGAMGLIEPLLALTLRRRFRAQHEQLKRILEAQ